jgi:hypothetical protein
MKDDCKSYLLGKTTVDDPFTVCQKSTTCNDFLILTDFFQQNRDGAFRNLENQYINFLGDKPETDITEKDSQEFCKKQEFKHPKITDWCNAVLAPQDAKKVDDMEVFQNLAYDRQKLEKQCKVDLAIKKTIFDGPI